MQVEPEVLRALKNWGLSENEIRVYVAALKVEETGPLPLSRATGIPRTTVYTVLTELALMGLVELESSDGVTKQQTKVRAKNPSELRQILWRKRRELVKKEMDLLAVLPQLKQDFVKERVSADFRFYPGIEGVREVLWGDEVDEEMLVLDYQTPMDTLGTEWMNRWVDKEIRLRKRAKTKEYNLIPLTQWTRHVMGYQYARDPNYLNNVEYRSLDLPHFNLCTRMTVKGEYVSVMCVEGKEVWGLKVRSGGWAASVRAMFWALWGMGQPITGEVITGWGENEYFVEEKKRGG